MKIPSIFLRREPLVDTFETLVMYESLEWGVSNFVEKIELRVEIFNNFPASELRVGGVETLLEKWS